jgi:CubicO group peptidase (beta-lactamase class C family)
MDSSILEDLLAASGYTTDGPGVAVALRGSDSLVHTAASGRAHPHTAFTPSTVSYLGSVAKQMVGVCAAMLVVNGHLDVESTAA